MKEGRKEEGRREVSFKTITGINVMN